MPELEHDKLLLQVTLDLGWLNSQDIESDTLGEWSALSDSDNISWLNSESWGAVSLEGLVSLLESLELSNVMQVISSNDDGSVHFVGDDETLVNSSSDGWASSEWALVVNVITFNGFLWGLESYKTKLALDSGEDRE